MEEKVYDFCPKCGALTLNGVCPSCGKKGRMRSMRHSEENVSSHIHTSSDDIWQNQYSSNHSNSNLNNHSNNGSSNLRKKESSIVRKRRTIMIFYFVLLAAGCILPLFFSYLHTTKTTSSVVDQFLEDEDSDIFSSDNSDSSTADDSDTSISNDGDSIWDSSHENHFGESFDGEYYTRFVDWIDESTGYEVNREEYVYKDEATSTDIVVSYVQIENDEQGRDMSYINETLREYAEYYQKVMEGDSEESKMTYADCIVRCDTYVTYNDEDKVSILINEETDMAGVYKTGNLQAYTIDLAVGKITYSQEMLDYDMEFVRDWMDMSEKQNGHIAADGVNFYEKDLIDFFNSTNCIAFYTPMGMEVGYSYYDYTTGISGWITVTLKDYEKYLKKM